MVPPLLTVCLILNDSRTNSRYEHLWQIIEQLFNGVPVYRENIVVGKIHAKVITLLTGFVGKCVNIEFGIQYSAHSHSRFFAAHNHIYTNDMP